VCVLHGACLDTGAQRTIPGKSQAKAYLASNSRDANLATSKGPGRYRLGGGSYVTIGIVHIRVPIAEDYFLPVAMNVINLKVPLLMGLDILDLYHMWVNDVTNHLVCINEGVSLPLVRKLGRISLDWGSIFLYTFPELQRIHKHFYHAKPERLYALMSRAEDEHAAPKTLRQLENVTEACDLFQRLEQELSRFRVAIPDEDICFNRRVMIDILTLKQTLVLHVVDRDTLFSATTFLHDKVDTKSVWDAFIRIWVAAYAGYPEQLHADQGKSLQSQEWKEMMRNAGIKRVIRMDHPGIPVDLALALAVWAMNQTAVPAGVSPHSLVLGVNPRMPVEPADLPDHRERCNA